ncbi:hypothetical protein, partial [Priestia megaterium]|uniref:hypothetical protein n=1 Tax=Priestia megaterium TaxID=1404 RepID=UPI0035B5D0A7
PEEGAALFQYVLSDINNRHLLVSTGDLGHRMKQWISMNADSIAKEEKKAGALHTRPELNNPYAAYDLLCFVAWSDIRIIQF